MYSTHSPALSDRDPMKMRLPLLFLTLALVAGTPALAQGPERVMVLVNQASESSRLVAHYYVEKRGIPASNVCSLEVPETRTISRPEFEEKILEPAAQCLRVHALQDQILYLVTTMGLPLMIDGDTGPVGDVASVDSELSLLYPYMVYGNRPGYGKVENPFFGGRSSRQQPVRFSRSEFDIHLVSRLTGATVLETLLRIDRGIAASQPSGSFCFDLPAQRQTDAEQWVEEASAWLRKRGQSVLVENTSAVLEPTAPVLGYCFHSAHAGRGPVPDWVPGGLAVDLSRTIPAEDATGLPALASNATGFGGFIAETGPEGLFRPQLLFESYLSGLNLVESYYRALRYVGWRQVIVGDPLVRPFPGKSKTPDPTECALEPASRLPGCFAGRRRAYLIQHYSSGREAVDELLTGEGLAARGEAEPAWAALQRSLKHNPYIPDTHLLLASILEQQGDFGSACIHYEEALQLGLRSAELHRKLASLTFYQLDDPQRAKPHALWLYSKAGPENREVARLWAEVNRKLGNLREAESVYHRLIELDASPPAFAFAALGELYLEQDDKLRAEKFLEKALQVSQDKPNPGFDAATVQQLLAGLKQPAEDESGTSHQTTAAAKEDRIIEAKVVRRLPVQYPSRAQSQGVQGVVVLSVLVDEYGQYLKADVKHGHPWLAEAAKESVQRWAFEPQMINGKQMPGRVTVVFKFALNGAKPGK